MEHKFEPFERVLVRNKKDEIWCISFFSYVAESNSVYKYCCLGELYQHCIPYAGNEHLLGTTDSPEPKHEYKWGEIVEVQYELEKKWRKAVFIKREGDTFWCIANGSNKVTMWDSDHVRPLKEEQ